MKNRIHDIYRPIEQRKLDFQEVERALSEAEICQQMERETKEKCDLMVAEAELKAQACWDNCAAKIRQLVESYEGLQQAMDLFSALSNKPGDPLNKINGRMY